MEQELKEKIFKRLIAYCVENGIELLYDARLKRANGLAICKYVGKTGKVTKTIRLRISNKYDKLHVLAHEIGHHVVHFRKLSKAKSRAEFEKLATEYNQAYKTKLGRLKLEAEADVFGLDTINVIAQSLAEPKPKKIARKVKGIHDSVEAISSLNWGGPIKRKKLTDDGWQPACKYERCGRILTDPNDLNTGYCIEHWEKIQNEIEEEKTMATKVKKVTKKVSEKPEPKKVEKAPKKITKKLTPEPKPEAKKGGGRLGLGIIFGEYKVAAFIRWMGRNGYNRAQAQTVLMSQDLDVKDSTVQTNITDGKRDDLEDRYGKPIELKPKHAKEVKKILAAAVKESA